LSFGMPSGRDDSFEEQVIVGTQVRVRAAPRADAAIVGSLSHCIVPIVRTDEWSERWTAIDLGGGGVGYVSKRYIKSPIAYRANFTFLDGRWRMTFFVGGD
jgi:hypothetical protein